MNPLTTVKGALTTGFVLALLLAFAITPTVFNEFQLARWLHILSGVMWIGLLYYFNVVQIPGLAAAGADKGGPGGAGIAKYIAPTALWWFRWAALATWLTGAWYLGRGGNFLGALALGLLGPEVNTYQLVNRHRRLARHDHVAERLGPHLAEPEENPRDRSGDGRREGQGAKSSHARLQDEFRVVHTHAAVHGGGWARRQRRHALLTETRLNSRLKDPALPGLSLCGD